MKLQDFHQLRLASQLTIPTSSSYISIFSLYYIIGWGLPVLMTMTWAIVTGLHISSHCWFGYNHTSYYWIVEGPRLALIAVNFFFVLTRRSFYIIIAQQDFFRSFSKALYVIICLDQRTEIHRHFSSFSLYVLVLTFEAQKLEVSSSV